MTKEEYEQLLKSDYWKGYSYALIKERNFTCQDCGRSFPGERNKLQVHHLNYRDTNPWSYRPEELIVLCEDCHKRRHGIFTSNNQQNDADGYTRSVSSGYNNNYYYNKSERDVPPASQIPSNLSSEDSPTIQKRHSSLYLGIAFVVVLFLSIGLAKHLSIEQSQQSAKKKGIIENESMLNRTIIPSPYGLSVPLQTKHVEFDEPVKKQTHVKQQSNQIKHYSKTDMSMDSDESATQRAIESIQTTIDCFAHTNESTDLTSGEVRLKDDSEEKTILKSLEDREYASVVERAKREGVSTEGTTLEILDRLNRKHQERK